MTNRRRGLLLVFLPAVVYFLVFNYAPMVGIVVAFENFLSHRGALGSEFVGLDNFRALFGDSDFLRAIRNTLAISLLKITFGFAAPLTLALLLHEVRHAGVRRSVQTITFLPHLLSWVILGGIFLLVFAAEGPANRTLAGLGVSPKSFLGDDGWFLFLLVFTHIWQSAGYGAVIYLAALSAIPVELYEAARIDGADRWQLLRHVTLPALVPTIVVLLTLNLGHVMNAGFDQIHNLYNPLVYDVADILDTYVLRLTTNLSFGLSTAADLFKSVVGMMLLFATNALARRLSEGEQGLW